MPGSEQQSTYGAPGSADNTSWDGMTATIILSQFCISTNGEWMCTEQIRIQSIAPKLLRGCSPYNNIYIDQYRELTPSNIIRGHEILGKIETVRRKM
eukprot:7574580-Ditylum_brightwellii.AAC.1